MKRVLRTILVGGVLLVLLLVVKNSNAFEYPIKELGGCRDQRECRLFCEIPNHKAACWSWGVYSMKRAVLGESTPEEKLAPLDVTFPIAELGNCENLADCREFCASPSNKYSCRVYGQTHGLTNKQKIIDRAEEELGCTTQAECRAYCEIETNKDTCREFAKKYHLRRVSKARIIEYAKTDLGCDTYESCRIYCADSVHREECRDFAQKIGRSARRIIKTKGDCKTVDECRDFCEELPNECPNFPKTGRFDQKRIDDSLDDGEDETNETDETNQSQDDTVNDDGDEAGDSDLDQ